MAQLPPPPLAYPKEPNKTGAIITLVGAAAIVLGSFLPWASVATVFGTISLAGTEGDGVITLVIGGIIGVLAGLELGGKSRRRTAAMIVGIVALGIGVFEIANVSDTASEVSSQFARASVGIGLWAVLGGAALALLGSLQSR
jgi:hypothetical protein